MTKLTPAQAAVLRAASVADGGGADTADIAKPTIWSLIKRGYIAATDDPGQVTITEAGRAAIAEEGAAPQTPSSHPTPGADAAKAEPAAPKGKIGLLLGLLSQEGGATIETMMAATGWQAHSVRGAISGSIKKALGHTVVSTKTEGGRVYRIAAETEA